MGDNPYQSPADTQAGAGSVDLLYWPAIGCLGISILGTLAAAAHSAFAIFLLWLAHENANDRHVGQAKEMVLESFGAVIACVVGIIAAICMFRRRARWLVLLAAAAGLVTCLPAPLAVIILMRLWRRDVWSSFQ